jgi:hypothetical protein
MPFWPIVSDLLTEFDLLELTNDPGSHHKRDEKRRHRRIDDPKTLVPKNV